jgi:uncharacterized protein (DUF302 family)
MTEVSEPGYKTVTHFDGVLITFRSEKSFFEVTKAIESRLQRLSITKHMEYVTHGDWEGLEAYTNQVSLPTKFMIFFELDLGTAFRLAGIPIESKTYLIGNTVLAQGMFKYTAAAGQGAPMRVHVSKRDGEKTRIDMELPSKVFGKFPEMRESDVPRLLDDEMVKVFEEAGA